MNRFPTLSLDFVRQWRSLVGWSIALALIVSMMLAVWPSVRDMADIEQFLASYPEAFQKMFNLQDYSSGAGYLNAELFSSTLPVLLIVFAIARGARSIAGEEETGQLELVLTTPVRRSRLLTEKAAGLVLSVLILGAVVFLTTTVGSRVLGMRVGIGSLAIGSVAISLLAIELGLIALAVGAATGRRTIAIATAATAAVLGYLLQVLGQLLPAFEPWSVLSPFRQSLERGPVAPGVSWPFLAVIIVGALVTVAVAPRWNRRDVGV